MKKKFLGLLLLASISTVSLSGCFLFQKKKYNVTFYVEMDNQVIETIQVTKNEEFSYPDAPKYPGYTFTSWSADVNKTTSDLTIYARYTANKYQITLDYNHDNVPTKNIEVTYDKGYTLETPSYEGHTFAGWFDKNNKQYTSGTYKTVGNLYLTASWSSISYNISYVLDGGVNNVDNPTKAIYEDIINLRDPTKEHYEFKGWYSDSSFSNQVTSLSKVTSDVTLYAKFEIVKYDVKFYVGTNNFYSTKVAYNNTIKFESTYNYNQNNNFVGWFVNNRQIDLATYKVTDNIDVYAKYEENCLFVKKGSEAKTFVIGNNTCSIIGFELTLNIKNGLNVSIKESSNETIYSIKNNTLYMNVMFDENNASSKNYLTLLIDTNLGVNNIFDSYEIVIYERVNGTIQIVEKDFLIF